MGNIDSVPVVSKLRSLGEYTFGYPESALRTQENVLFQNTYPVISQIQSFVYIANGDHKSGLELQTKFVEDMEAVIDGIPVLDHLNRH
ncbi:unnamed protein product [Allacma fusca]|uniref:Uncharacterized protein n=1 Tax=Allacma fusca TaxID=39272 RepID=A0A8J2KYQ2_9HEXA|nr:unnamed protein product [Allacma fusca]